MSVLKLLESLGGEILANKARVVVDGQVVIIGRLHGSEWVTTAEGEKLQKLENSSKPAPVAEEKPEVKQGAKIKNSK